MESTGIFDWISFYTELADKLRPYRYNRKELIQKIRNIFRELNMKLPTLDRDNNIIDIDPFTVFGLFNKGLTAANRILIAGQFGKEFNISSEVPDGFDGIPVLNLLSSTYYRFSDDKNRGEHDIDNLWEVFESALDYAETHKSQDKERLIQYYDIAAHQCGIKWNLTMGLFWIRPYEYMNLDSRNRWFITDTRNMPQGFVSSVGKLGTLPSGTEYLNIIEKAKEILHTGQYSYKTFPELSYAAWAISEKVNQEKKTENTKSSRGKAGGAVADQDVDKTHYWLYSPGENACEWDTFYDAGIMAIGWDAIGDLSAFDSQNEMKEKMQNCMDPSLSYKNSAHATWQFANEIKPGDVIFVKKGMHTIVGRGVVTSDYMFDSSRMEMKNVRQVEWSHKGSWQHPGQAVTKTLTDITEYTDYVNKLKALFIQDDIDEEEIEVAYPAYTKEDFLQEVYMPEGNYDKLTHLLQYKKNIILQGAPGVGKTFAAKRLAYSMIGERNPDRVMMVQFHQSYSYEDFMVGYRPTENGFALKHGPFYNFCKKAEIDPNNEYFFIIDEINRGNLSKIFGELFMLIEKDKRGIALQLLYTDEQFAVPENVYLIGMMNTADRSLALLDYALRRRFAFYEMSPAFDTNGFIEYLKKQDNKKMDELILVIRQLNQAIINDDSLGRGFCIGHSYFCSDSKLDVSQLQSIVDFEILPLLEEYWFDEPDKIQHWKRMLNEALK